MTKVVIDNIAGKSIDCQNNSKSLLEILLEDIDWMHACGGKGRCTTCKAVILQGQEFLSDRTEAEMNYINLQRLGDHERLACQVSISGNIVIKVPEETKLPHITYSDDVH